MDNVPMSSWINYLNSYVQEVLGYKLLEKEV